MAFAAQVKDVLLEPNEYNYKFTGEEKKCINYSKGNGSLVTVRALQADEMFGRILRGGRFFR